MKAILLAAGQGKRLSPYTKDIPKCLVSLGDKPLIEHQIAVLQQAGITDIHIVTGYCHEKLETLGFKTFYNSQFAETNMVASLMCAKELFDGSSDILVTYADIVYELKILEALLECPSQLSTTIDKEWLKLWNVRSDNPLDYAETLKLNSDHTIIEIGKTPQTIESIEGQFMGLIKIKAAFAPNLVKIYQSMDPQSLYEGRDLPNMYMTAFLQHLIDQGYPVKAVDVYGGWLEIDTKEDLELFNSMHRDGSLSNFYKIPQTASS